MYDHEHKYFLFQVKQIFELKEQQKDSVLYESIEYGYSGCNCGDVIKTRVKNKP